MLKKLGIYQVRTSLTVHAARGSQSHIEYWSWPGYMHTPNRQQSPPSREPFGHSLFDEQSAVDLGVISRLRPHKSATGKCDIWAESASLLPGPVLRGANWYMALAPSQECH